jgi:hypothetical protein
VVRGARNATGASIAVDPRSGQVQQVVIWEDCKKDVRPFP